MACKFHSINEEKAAGAGNEKHTVDLEKHVVI